MSKKIYSNQHITQYLLGRLSESETEHLDELSVIDDDFADALKDAENSLLDNYVQGDLMGEELNQFKSYYLASPLRRNKVIFAEAFREFDDQDVHLHVTESSAEQSGERSRKPGWLSAIGAYVIPRSVLRWGFAAAAVGVLIAGSLLVFEKVRMPQQVSQTQSNPAEVNSEQEPKKPNADQRPANANTRQEPAQVPDRSGQDVAKQLKQQPNAEQPRRRQQPSPAHNVSIASFVLSPQVRSLVQLPIISIPDNANFVAMRLNLEPDDQSDYRVELIDEANNQILWHGKLLARTSGAGRFVAVTFRSDLLKPRVYLLRLTPTAKTGTSEVITAYRFKIVK